MDICQNSCENGPAREFSDKRFLLFRFMLQLLGSLFLTFMISSETYSIVKGTNWHVDMLVILLILIIIRSKSVSVWSECQKQLKSKSADQTLQPKPISKNGFPNGRIQFAFKLTSYIPGYLWIDHQSSFLERKIFDCQMAIYKYLFQCYHCFLRANHPLVESADLVEHHGHRPISPIFSFQLLLLLLEQLLLIHLLLLLVFAATKDEDEEK